MFTPVFDRSVYDTSTLQPSYWEASAERRDFPRLAQDVRTEVAIIGGGYTGLSAAYHLAKDHGIEAVVLEAGPIAWGASSRNGGFVTYPPTKMGIGELVSRYGLDGAKEQTLEQLGKELGITKERVRQIESRAQEKLRKFAKESKIDTQVF